LVGVDLRLALRRRGSTRVLMTALFVTLGIGSILHFCCSIAARAENLPVSTNGILGRLEADVPMAIFTPPPPCTAQPGPDGKCSSCTSSVPGASDYEKSLPVPTPAPGFDYVVQLVNESDVTILGTANAANQGSASPGGQVPPPIAVEPREKTWVMLPKGAPNNGNILTIDIPLGWEGTQCSQSNPNCMANGPRFYPRTGCKFDLEANLAQCETGSCGDAYDCGQQALKNPPRASAGRAPVSIVEWTFNSQGGQGYEYPDISLVDGVSITTDVQALGPHCASKPGAPTEPNWLSQNQPLAIHGIDLRETARCMPTFQLTRGEVGQIIQGEGNPEDVVACFTNCGRYEYPSTPFPSCDPTTDARCKNWLAFCCFAAPGDPNHIYTQTCTNSDQCEQSGGCWDNHNGPAKCSCRAFLKNDTCPANVCTHPNPPGFSSQPFFGHCSDVTDDPTACIGDDTVHAVFPGAYTWPNDPQTYSSDARSYRIIFAPGFNPGASVPITDSGEVPLCSSLPAAYGYATQYGGPGSGDKPCDVEVNQGCAQFGGAILSPTSDHLWACNISDGGPVTTGAILCRWPQVACTMPTATATSLGSIPSPTPSPTLGASVTSTSVSVVGVPGAGVDAGTFTVRNNLGVTESISSATISVSHPALFSTMTLSGGGQTATAIPPYDSTLFTFAAPVTVPAGSSITFSLSGVIAMHPVMLGGETKYASLELNGSLPANLNRWPLAGGMMLLGIAPLGLPGSRRRRAIIMLALAVGMAALSSGCGGSSNSNVVASSQQVTSVAVSAAGIALPAAGMPASMGTVKAN
jgi:hypothetical protein